MIHPTHKLCNFFTVKYGCSDVTPSEVMQFL